MQPYRGILKHDLQVVANPYSSLESVNIKWREYIFIKFLKLELAVVKHVDCQSEWMLIVS